MMGMVAIPPLVVISRVGASSRRSQASLKAEKPRHSERSPPAESRNLSLTIALSKIAASRVGQSLNSHRRPTTILASLEEIPRLRLRAPLGMTAWAVTDRVRRYEREKVIAS